MVVSFMVNDSEFGSIEYGGRGRENSQDDGNLPGFNTFQHVSALVGMSRLLIPYTFLFQHRQRLAGRCYDGVASIEGYPPLFQPQLESPPTSLSSFRPILGEICGIKWF